MVGRLGCKNERIHKADQKGSRKGHRKDFTEKQFEMGEDERIPAAGAHCRQKKKFHQQMGSHSKRGGDSSAKENLQQNAGRN